MNEVEDFDVLDAASEALFMLNAIQKHGKLDDSVNSKFEKSRVELINAMTELESENIARKVVKAGKRSKNEDEK